MQGLVTRVTENVMVAVITAAVLWLVAHPGMSQGIVDRAITGVGSVNPTWRNLFWAGSSLMSGLAVLFLVNGSRRTTYQGDSFWEFELHMPSWPVTLFGASVALALVGWALSLCSVNNWWGLVALAVATWMVLRFVARARSGWQHLLRGI